jgi:hypothetical protein
MAAPQRNHQIQSIFHPWLARKARELATSVPGFSIISTCDFPVGAPIHEDGSSTYDPRKPLAYFAVELTSEMAVSKWSYTCEEIDRMIKAHAVDGGDHGSATA